MKKKKKFGWIVALLFGAMVLSCGTGNEEETTADIQADAETTVEEQTAKVEDVVVGEKINESVNEATTKPTPMPTATLKPTVKPTPEKNPEPTPEAIPAPTEEPIQEPTLEPTPEPTPELKPISEQVPEPEPEPETIVNPIPEETVVASAEITTTETQNVTEEVATQADNANPANSGNYAVNNKNGKIHIVGECSATKNGKNAMEEPIYFDTYEAAENYSVQIKPNEKKRKCGNCWK
ncbi:MAG: hypothetical protein J6J79_01440 [Lachnospiraceae bacterium]|nr:hypothetical protein [Lachnospiraceae bacterium]